MRTRRKTETVRATSTEDENGDSASVTSLINVEVNAIADAPNLVTENASGDEDSPINLSISTSADDLGDSEVLTILIEGVPEGAILNAGQDSM